MTPWIAARQASLSITNSRSSLRLTSIESVMPSSHLILCHPILLLPPIPPSMSFPVSQLFAWGSQSTRVSALASFLPKKICCGSNEVLSPIQWYYWCNITFFPIRVFWGFLNYVSIRSDQISRSVVSDSLRPQYTWHNLPFKPFLMYSSVALSTFILLCNHHHHHLQNFFVISNGNSIAIK